ncbi:MAG: DUF1549 and DUF1553 domain-containing protein [Planctomycetaceae bacterium]|nr:DUF1549 and DUF1553 domain-containing protein [Planctomycetaceae bacterium]
MWARNLLFIAVCIAGLLAIGDQLLRRNRIDRPADFEPGRFAAAATPSPSPGDIGQTLARLNSEFRRYWQAKQLDIAPRADDLTIARRLSLALTGTVPSVEEIRALENVSADERLEWWTSHLLEDRRHSDYLAERLARAYVGNEMGPFIVFRRGRFERWLSDQIEANTPYDEVVRRMISERGVWTGKPAANFITATSDPTKDNQPDEVRLAGRTARAFLGMRIDCLQCHDDKLGNVNLGYGSDSHSGTQADFHQLAAFFGPTSVSLVGVHDGGKPYETKYLDAEKEEVVPPQVPFAGELIESYASRREQLARWVTHPSNKPFARAAVNRFWALMFGRPLVEPIDDIPLESDAYPPGFQLLADDFTASGFDVRRLLRLIAASEPFTRDSRADFQITAAHEDAWAAFPLTRLRPEQVAGSLIQASSLSTLNGEAHVVLRIAMFGQTNEFVRRYGDLGEDEFTDRSGTIPQRLLMMNGELVKERTAENPVLNATTRIAMLSTRPEKQVEVSYLATLTRRPTEAELAHFVSRLQDTDGGDGDRRTRQEALEDLYWTLINSTEFSWNH